MDYEPISRLGRGGMGTVDLARDSQGNKVAMKRLTLHGSASEMLRARQRLLREAQVLRRLNHPNIVRLLDVVEDGDEIILVMPYLPGGNLAERVSQHGPAPPAEVERLAQRLLGALATAHAEGIVHRDIKPGNVLYDSEGEPLLADFGLAFSWDQTEGLTAAGMVVGTPGFIAPEQARGEQLTPASDVFSLGATLRFAATGVGPFGSGDPTLLMVRAAGGKVERLPRRLPAPLRHHLGLMLEARPERRPSAAELLNGGTTVRRPSTRAVVGVAAAVAVLGGLTFAATRSDGDGDAGAPPIGGERTDKEMPPSGGNDDASTGTPSSSVDLDPDADDDQLIETEIRGKIDPGDDVDVHRVPLADGPGGCSEPITLTLYVVEGSDLMIDVYSASSNPVDTKVASTDRPAQVVIQPRSCEDAYRIEVAATEIRDSTTVYSVVRDE